MLTGGGLRYHTHMDTGGEMLVDFYLSRTGVVEAINVEGTYLREDVKLVLSVSRAGHGFLVCQSFVCCGRRKLLAIVVRK